MSDLVTPDSNEPSSAAPPPTPPRSESVRARIAAMRQSRNESALGLDELIALSASALLLVAAIGAYFFMLVPARTRLDDAERKRAQLQTILRDSQLDVKRNTDTQATVAQIGESLQNFEAGKLATRAQGRTAVIDQLNALLRRNNLRLNTGFTFAALDALQPNGQPSANASTTSSKSAAKYQSVFPGIGISVTVEGPYANLRRFVRDIETSNQFIIINAVELQGVTDTKASRQPPDALFSAPASPNSANIGGGAPLASALPATPDRAALVSLRLDMAAYFRRDAAITAAATTSDDTGAVASRSQATTQ